MAYCEESADQGLFVCTQPTGTKQIQATFHEYSTIGDAWQNSKESFFCEVY